MDRLIAILLWLGSFQPNGQYTTEQMEAELEENAVAVQIIIENQALQEQVWDSCGVSVPTVIITGGGE